MKKICKNCRHSEWLFNRPKELYCMNSECDKEFSNDPECDNYMGVVEENDSCKLFSEL